MGVFDTMSGNVICPSCHSVTPCDVQFKWLDPSMNDYHIGDYIYGSQPFSVLDSEITACVHCRHTFYSLAIGRYGYLYGFISDEEYEMLGFQLPRRSGDDTGLIQFHIHPQWLKEENIDVFLQRMKQEVLNHPEKDRFYFPANSQEELSEAVCRIPWGKTSSNSKLQIGDACYYDDRNHGFDAWKTKDVTYTVCNIHFDELTQTYNYDIQEVSGDVMQGVPENKTLTGEERNRALEELEQAEQQMIQWDKQDQLRKKEGRTELTKEERKGWIYRLSGSFQKSYLVERLKREGKISPDFKL